MKFTDRTVRGDQDRGRHPLPRQLGQDDRADRLRDEVAPAGLGRPDAESEEAQARLQEDRRRDAEGRDDGQRSEDVRAACAETGSSGPGTPTTAGRGDELGFAQDEELAADEAARSPASRAAR